MIVSAGISDVGCVRAQNQDCIHRHPDETLFVVADGMGGEQCGERAAELAVEVIRRFFDAGDDPRQANLPSPWPFGYNDSVSKNENRMMTALGLANQDVRREARTATECRGMGATIVAATVRDSVLTIGSVGDCRAYLLRANALMQLTTDDTVIQRLLMEGTITPEEIPMHPLRHQVTAAIGASESLEVQTLEFALETGDRLLMCSDGLHGVITDDQIRDKIENLTPQDAVQELVNAVKAAGAPDNVSCVLVAYGGDFIDQSAAEQ